MQNSFAWALILNTLMASYCWKWQGRLGSYPCPLGNRNTGQQGHPCHNLFSKNYQTTQKAVFPTFRPSWWQWYRALASLPTVCWPSPSSTRRRTSSWTRWPASSASPKSTSRRTKWRYCRRSRSRCQRPCCCCPKFSSLIRVNFCSNQFFFKAHSNHLCFVLHKQKI